MRLITPCSLHIQFRLLIVLAMFKFQFVFFIFVVGVFATTNGLQCKSCKQNVPSELVDIMPPGFPTLPPTHEKCLSDPTAANNQTCTGGKTYCAKISAKINDVEAVIRACLNPVDLWYDEKSGCFDSEQQLPEGVKDFKACFCAENLCNSSTKLVVGTFGTFIGLLLISLFKNF